MNIKNYLEENGIYEENKKIEEFFEKDEIKNILNSKITNFITNSSNSYYELDKKLNIFLFWEEKYFEKFERKNIINLEIHIITEKNFWNFSIIKKHNNFIEYLYSLIFFIIFWFSAYSFFLKWDYKSMVFFIFIIIFISILDFKNKKLSIKSKNFNFDKKFIIYSDNKNLNISEEIQEKIFELEKNIKIFSKITFLENKVIITTKSNSSFDLKKKILNNYIIFKKCEKIFE